VPGLKDLGFYTPFPDLYSGVGMTCVAAPWPGTSAALRQDAKIILRAFELAKKFGGLLP
jgi:hypothetical protein